MTYNQVTYSKQQLLAFKARGAEYIVVALVSTRQHEAGQCVSWHKSYGAACRKVGGSDYYTVQDICDAIFYANH